MNWQRENKELYPVRLCDLGLIDYTECLKLQEAARRRVIEERGSRGLLFFLEHPHTYTHGRLADGGNLLVNTELLNERGIAVYEIDRGGDFTYHGPGQLVAYPIFDLKRLGLNVRQYMHALEEVVIRVLAGFGIAAGRHSRYMGVWVDGNPRNGIRGLHLSEKKICAVGVGVRKWVTKHGFAFNINTDLSFFSGIIPCGIKNREITSLQELKGGVEQDFTNIIDLTKRAFAEVFNLEMHTIARDEFEEVYIARRR